MGVIYGIALYFSGVKLEKDIKQVLSYLPTAASLAIVVFEKWLWKLGFVQRFHRRPRLDGLWRVELMPDPRSHISEGGNTGPIRGFIIIEQTFWSIAITQFTEESASYSKTASFLKHGDSSKQTLTFVYDNIPKREHLSRSPRNRGGCDLEVANGVPTSASGSYYTDRFTAGSMSLALIDRTTNYVDYDQASERLG